MTGRITPPQILLLSVSILIVMLVMSLLVMQRQDREMIVQPVVTLLVLVQEPQLVQCVRLVTLVPRLYQTLHSRIFWIVPTTLRKLHYLQDG